MRRIAVKRLGSMRFALPRRQYWCKLDGRFNTESFEYTALNMQDAAEQFMVGGYCRGTRPEPVRVLVSPDDRRWFWCTVMLHWCTVMLQPKLRVAVTA